MGFNPLNRHCFDPSSPFKRHETCDWGLNELFTDLQTSRQENSPGFLSANYSRLVCDLNRSPETSISLTSSETGREISGNMDLDEQQISSRNHEIYQPYQSELKNMIAQTYSNHGGAIVVEMHSYSPAWNGQKRDVQIGTLKLGKNPVSNAMEEFLAGACSKAGFHLAENAPYDLSNLPAHRQYTARSITDQGVYYTGLEIRNDLLGDPETRMQIANILGDALTHLVNHPAYNQLVKIGENRMENHRVLAV